MDKYNDFLAVQVLNEKSIVTYRTLSRALKVHVNLAKQMLWDFQHRTNSKKPGSVHATYLLSGLRKTIANTSTRTTQTRDGDDTVMASSPPLPGSSMPMQEEEGEPTLTRSILLVKEEQLEKAKATFVELRGIHIYSLQANRLIDYQSLTKCTQTIFQLLREEDPLKSGEQYGTIQNAFVKRRSRKTPLPPARALPAAAPKQVSAPTKEEAKPIVKANPTKAAAAKTASLKRQGSDIMASFAKNSQGKAKTAVKQDPAKEAEDSPMADVSDDEYGDAPDMDIDVNTAAGKLKQDRKAELEAMMDVEDEVKEDLNAEEEEEEADETAQAETEPVSQEIVTKENGRRRGRRKVMKKKTATDEEGFLVTREEAVWESFSEDEPAPKRAKTSAPAPVPAPNKKGAKPAQGNIMSFFAKK